MSAQPKTDTEKSGERIFEEDFVETLPGIYYLLTADGEYLDWNRKLERVSGYTGEEIGDMHPMDFFAPEHHDFLNRKIREVLEEGQSDMTLPLLTKSGREIPCHFTGLAAEVNGKTCIRGLAVDISEMKQAKSKADKLDHTLAAIVESSEDAIIGKKIDGTITSWNKGAENMYGYMSGEALGKNISLIVPDRKMEELESIMKKVGNGENVNQLETVRVTKSGNEISISLNVSSILNDEGSIIGASAIARDITEQKKTEEMNRFLLNASKILAESLDYDKTLSNVAKLAVRSIADWCSIELLENGSMKRVTVQHIDPEKREFAKKLQKEYPRHPERENSMLDKVIEAKEPLLIEQIPDELLHQQAVDKKHYRILKKLGLESAIIAPMLIRGEIKGVITLISESPDRIYTKKDEEFAVELARYAGLAIEDARLYREAKTLNEELEERVQRRTRQLEKVNEELESFSYSVSHDLRAPLRAIAGYTDLLLDNHAQNLNGEGKKFLRILKDESTRMGELIDDLLAFSRMSRKEKHFVDCSMNEIVDNAIKSISATYDEESFELDVAELSSVPMDPKLMKQVWINLIGNAITYRKPGSVAHIAIESYNGEPGAWFVISDDGIGFDEKYREKIFGVFERLHTDSEIPGTGIGLALVKRIVQRHSGDVEVESTPGKGTTFKFSIPKEPDQ